MKGLLFSGSLGLMLSENASTSGMVVPVMTMADFNHERYGKAFAAVSVKTPPKNFPVVDRCICGDGDWNDWSSCISALNSLGLNGIETDPDNIFDVKMLEMNGQHLTSGGIYGPPGAEPDTGATLNATFLQVRTTLRPPWPAACAHLLSQSGILLCYFLLQMCSLAAKLAKCAGLGEEAIHVVLHGRIQARAADDIRAGRRAGLVFSGRIA